MEILRENELKKEICEEVREEEVDGLLVQAQEMIKICAANGGVGLSAPQVGINKRMFVWLVDDTKFEVVLNPKFYKGEKLTGTVEGCLSFPGEHYFLKNRYKRIWAVYFSWARNKFIKISKQLNGLQSFVYQHELKHLDGKTIKMEGVKVDERKAEQKED